MNFSPRLPSGGRYATAQKTALRPAAVTLALQTCRNVKTLRKRNRAVHQGRELSLCVGMKTVTLVVWLTVVAIPQVARGTARPLPVCLNNLRVIDGVAMQFALEHRLQATNSYAFEDQKLIAGFFDAKLPRCPSGGRYLPATNFAGRPRCSFHGDPEHPVNAERELADDLGRATAWRAASFALLALGALWFGRKWPAIIGFGVSVLFASLLALARSGVDPPVYSGGPVQAGFVAGLVEVSVYAAAALLVCTSNVKAVRLLGVALSVICVGIWLLFLTLYLQSS
ncbi:MAG: hypothetical protein ABMA26_18140 [Limisphaerales bacterium]